MRDFWTFPQTSNNQTVYSQYCHIILANFSACMEFFWVRPLWKLLFREASIMYVKAFRKWAPSPLCYIQEL